MGQSPQITSFGSNLVRINAYKEVVKLKIRTNKFRQLQLILYLEKHWHTAFKYLFSKFFKIQEKVERIYKS